MDLHTLRPGDKVRTIDNNVALVLSATEDGEWIKVRYLESGENPELVSTEDLCSKDEVAEQVA
jgi:hypothetical protein